MNCAPVVKALVRKHNDIVSGLLNILSEHITVNAKRMIGEFEAMAKRIQSSSRSRGAAALQEYIGQTAGKA